MKFQLVSTSSEITGKFKLEALSVSPDMRHYAAHAIGHEPEVGDEFVLETSWPKHQDNMVAATSEDYEKYGTISASGIFRRVE